MKGENYMNLEFPSKSSNEAFAVRPLPALRRNWIPLWTSWEISKQPSLRR